MHTSQDTTLSFYYSLTLGLLGKLQKMKHLGKAKCKPFIEPLCAWECVLYAGNPMISKTWRPT